LIAFILKAKNNMKFMTRALVAAALALGLLSAAQAQEAAIRKNLAERLPQMPAIDEVTRTPMPGLFEVRAGMDLFYTDADGSFLIQGQLIDTKQKRNLTEERKDKLLAIDFKTLPFKDAVTIVRGNGKRKLAVFEDPNCPYCKHFERDLQKVDNVTVYLFLYPILGPDSTEKSHSLWCAKDKARAWLDWMVRGQAVAPASCDAAAVVRNVDFGKKYQINGTPTMIFVDGTRVPGAVGTQEIEKLLADAKQ
jgi:thiol:disulfide interchange protein DsbC